MTPAELSIANEMLKCHSPLSAKWNDILLGVFPDDTRLKRALFTENLQVAITYLELKCEVLHQYNSAENIVRGSWPVVHETAYMEIAARTALKLCEDEVKKTRVPWWKRWAEQLALWLALLLRPIA